MPQTMLTVRGNLGANPDYLPEKTMEDGAILPSKLQAVVYENLSLIHISEPTRRS